MAHHHQVELLRCRDPLLYHALGIHLIGCPPVHADTVMPALVIDIPYIIVNVLDELRQQHEVLRILPRFLQPLRPLCNRTTCIPIEHLRKIVLHF